MDVVSAAMQRSAELVRSARSGSMAAGGAGALLAGPATGQALTRQTPTVQHVEQYRHYVDEVFSLVRVISQRVAGQPIRAAVVPDPDRERRRAIATTKGMTVKQRQLRQLKRRAKAVRTKRVLPTVFKTYAESAEVLDDHPFLELIRRPNPVMREYMLKFVTVASLKITGKAFWWITVEEDEDGKHLELWPIPSSWIEPWHEDADGKPHLFYCWRIRPAGVGSTFEVPNESIVYFHDPDPSNPLGSVSTLQAQARTVVAMEAVTEAQRRQFQNGLNPGLALIVGRHPDVVTGQPGQRPILTRDQRAQLITAVRQMYRGAVKQDEPLILDGLIEDAKRITPGVREMDYPESGRILTERLDKGFGVPPTVMGQIIDANRATATTSDELFCRNTVNPVITMMSEVMTGRVAPLYDGGARQLLLFIEEATTNNPDDDRADEAMLVTSGAIARNEQRARRGMEPIRDGDSCFVPGFGEVVIEPDDGDEDRGPGDAGRGF